MDVPRAHSVRPERRRGRDGRPSAHDRSGRSRLRGFHDASRGNGCGSTRAASRLDRVRASCKLDFGDPMTLKLYYSPGACSLAPHVTLEETGAEYEPVRVALAKGEQNEPAYRAINPKGRVPALAEGEFVVTENPAILRYIARRFPAAHLWPEETGEEAACAGGLAWLSPTIHVTYAHVRRAERYADSEAGKAEVAAKG